MEPVTVIATAAVVVFATIQAYREKRVRALATVCAALTTLSTVGFLLLVHVAS